jgi:hypothetical protein
MEEIELIEEALKDHNETGGIYKPVNYADENDQKFEILQEIQDENLVTNEANLHIKLSRHLRKTFIWEEQEDNDD